MTLRLIVLLAWIVTAPGVAIAAPGQKTGATARPAIDRFDEVTLERTSCRGRCPSYTVRIDGSGGVEYQGGADVKVKGAAASRLSPSQVKALVDAINEAGYFALLDRYGRGEGGCPRSWTDLPTAITTVRAGGRVKTIAHDLGCREQDAGERFGPVFPRALGQLEDRIDEIAGTARWVR